MLLCLLLLNADGSNAFSEPSRSSNSSCPQDSSSCALSATAMPRYTIFRRVSETFNAECIGFTLLQFVLRLVCDVGILRAEHHFVILDFFFVILNVLEVVSET